MAFTPIDEEEIIDEPVAEEAKPRFIPIEDDEFFGIGGEEEAAEPVTAPEVEEPVEAPRSRFIPIESEEFFGVQEPIEPVPVTGEEGFFRQAADVPLKIGESINTTLRGLTDLFGADNAVSQNLTQNADWYRSLLSAQALEDEQEIGRILKEAEDKDMLDQLAAGLEAFSVAPVDFIASGVGSLAVFAATGVLGRAAAVAGAARAGLTGAKAAQFVQRGVKATQIATGAGLGAGIVKGEIYQSVKDEMLARGKTEEEAKAIAMEAQSYGGKNLDQILIGAGLGTIDAFTGAEKILGKVLTKGGLAPNASRIGNILKSGITEAVPEFVQAAQEKFASNLALRREGVDVSLTQGVFSQGALEGLVGLGLGVGTGAIEPRIQTEPTKEEVSAAAAETQDVARQSMDVAPATASLVEGEAEQIIQSQAETPDEKVARLQREAQEAADIDLEEEPPVSGLPPERIKSARWFESASRNRLKELQDKDDAGMEDFTNEETEEFEFLKASPTPEQIAQRYGYQVRRDVTPTTVTPAEPAAAPTPAESLLTRKSELDAEAKRLGADNISSFNSMYATRESLTEEQRNLLNQYGEYNKQVVELGWRDAAKLDDADFGRWEKIKLTTKPVSDQELTDLGKLYLAFNERGETQKAESVLKSIQSGKRKTNNTIDDWFKATDETLSQQEIDTINRENQEWNDSVDSMNEILGRKTPPEEISPTNIAPTLTPTPTAAAPVTPAVAPVEPVPIVTEETPPPTPEAPAEAAAPPQPTVAGFTTAKGSTYEVTPEGKTVRTKRSEGRGQGETYEPHSVLFVPSETNYSILSDMQGGMGDYSIRMGYSQGDRFIQVTDTNQIPADVTPQVAIVSRSSKQIIPNGVYDAQRNPEVGFNPVEKLYKTDGTSSTHLGNQITEIRPIAEAAPEAPVTPTPTEVAPTTIVPPVTPEQKKVAETVAPAAVLPEQEPADIPDTRGQNRQFHGAREPIQGIAEGYYNAANIYGGESTFYTTDAVDIAAGYQRRKPNAVVYEVTQKAPVNFFNMEERRPVEEWIKIFNFDVEGIPRDEFFDVGAELAGERTNGTPNLREIMDEMRDEAPNEMMSRDELQEYFSSITSILERQGYGGMTHIGGLKTKRPQHNVKIYFKPYEQIEIKPVDVRGNPVTPEASQEAVQAAEQKATQDFAQDLYGQEPYINHLRRVSEQMPNDKLKTAAFIHDSVEDGKMTLDEVRSQFGDDVAELVDVVSRRDDETYAQFIDRIAQNPEAAQIKLADLRENIRNVEDFKPSLRSRYEKAIAVLEPKVAIVERDRKYTNAVETGNLVEAGLAVEDAARRSGESPNQADDVEWLMSTFAKAGNITQKQREHTRLGTTGVEPVGTHAYTTINRPPSQISMGIGRDYDDLSLIVTDKQLSFSEQKRLQVVPVSRQAIADTARDVFAVGLELENNGKQYLVTPSTQYNDIRITELDSAGQPTGHIHFKNEWFVDDLKNLFGAKVFDERGPNQIKSIEPIVRDESGNIVPLSQRFQLATPEATPAAVEPTPVTPLVTPQLEPLRRVVKAEQTEDDVSGLVGQGLVELYKGQPVITQAGLEALPEAERPRLTPEARKIQIDTRTSEAAAEAISKNLRIRVDQVPPDVRMPAGWTLVGDVYVPPTKMAKIEDFEIEAAIPEEAGDVFANLVRRRVEVQPVVLQKPVGSQFQTPEEFRAAFDLRGQGHTRFAIRLDLMQEDGAITEDGKNLILATIWDNNTNDEFLSNMEMGSARKNVKSYGYGGRSRQTVEGGRMEQKPILEVRRRTRIGQDVDKRTALTLSTFWHEFGHAGYYSLLDAKQKKAIDDAFNKTTKSERIAFFAEGRADLESTEWFSKYYSKSKTEWFAQSFAEYVITQKSDQKGLVPVFEQILDKIKAVFTKLFNRKEQVNLNDIFDFILRGEAYGQKPTWQGYTMSTKPAVYGTRLGQAISPEFTKRLLEREGVSPQDERRQQIIDRISLKFKRSKNEYGNNKFKTEYDFGGRSPIIDKISFSLEQFDDSTVAIDYLPSKGGKYARVAIPELEQPFKGRAAAERAIKKAIAEIEMDERVGGAEEAAPEARESRRAIVTPQQDREYLDAVERGDLDAASRVVEDAASRAGYTVGPIVHGTKDGNKFTVFKQSENFERVNIGFHFGTREQAENRVRGDAEGKGGEFLNVYLKGNFVRIPDLGGFEPNSVATWMEKTKGWITPDVTERVDALLEKAKTAQDITNIFETIIYPEFYKRGYNGIIYKNQIEGTGDSYAVFNPEQIKSSEPVTRDDQGNIIPPSQRFQQGEADIRYARGQAGAGMTTDAVRARLEALGFGVEGMIRIVEDPQAAFEGRTIIQDGKAVRIELNASALNDDAAIDRVLNHEFAEAANADGALNKLVERLTPKEKKEINDAITRLGYEERVRTTEEAARAIEALAAGWKGRGFFERAVARVEAWGSKLGLKLTRRAAEYIAARNLSDINAGFKAAYNRFINVRGEAREGRAFVTPEENARFLELAKDPEANREELLKMVDEAAKKAGYTIEVYHGTRAKEFSVFESLRDGLLFFTTDAGFAEEYAEENARGTGEPRDFPVYVSAKNPWDYKNKNHVSRLVKELEKSGILGFSEKGSRSQYQKDVLQDIKEGYWSILENEKILSVIKSFGHDGIWMTEGGDITRNIAVFNPEQIKSAESITRDDQGNVIPLSERFQPAEADIRYSIRESRREDAIPTFSEGSPEASTLSTMASSMAKVDAASEAKPNPENKPTYKISEIASVWMDQGGDARQLQDLITENTNLTPANAKRVANAIAKQYGIQQEIALAATPEVLPETVTPEAEDRRKPKTTIQRVLDAITGVRVPPVKITANEKTLLKEQIKLKAAAYRDSKKAQQETAAEMVEAIKGMDIRGPIRPKQVAALMKRAVNVNFASETSVDKFIDYAAKVIENANYDRDVAEAKAAQKRAKEIAKRKNVAGPQKQVLNDIAKIEIKHLTDPREFAEAANYYMRAFKTPTSEGYQVIPDKEMNNYLNSKQEETKQGIIDADQAYRERLAEKYGVPLDEVNAVLDAEDIQAALVQYAKREGVEGMINEKVRDGLAALQRYNTAGMTQKQQELVQKILDLDIDGISTESRIQLIRDIDNILVNGQTNGVQRFVAASEGQSNAFKASKNKTFTNQQRAWINILLGQTIGKKTRGVGAEDQKEIALSLQSIADTFRNIFGKKNLSLISQIMGFGDLLVGNKRFQTDMREATEETTEFFNKLEKKYGVKVVSDNEGKIAEGVTSYLIQQFPLKTEEESIITRRSVIMQDVQQKRLTGDSEAVAEADIVASLLERIDGDSVQEILNNLKREFPANYEAVMWYKDTFLPKYKDFLREFDENFNNQANNYDNPNYLPIAYMFAKDAELTPEEQRKYYNTLSLTPKQAANSIKRQDYENLPSNKGKPAAISYNLRNTVYSSLSDQLKKAHTSAAWAQIQAFVNSKAAIEVFGNEANRGFMARRLELLQDSQDRRGYQSDGFSKVLDSVAIFLRRIGIGIGLGGVGQVIKQAPDQIVTTIANTGDPQLSFKNLMIMMFTKDERADAMKLMSKFSISERGDAAMGGAQFMNPLESGFSNLEKFVRGGQWARIKDTARRISDVWLIALKKSDFWAASSGWMTYYQKKLEEEGGTFTDWANEAKLVDTDPVRQRAAYHAELMIDLYQGSSDPTRMARLSQRGKSGYENAWKGLFLAFNSFVLQQRVRMHSDLGEGMSKQADPESAKLARRGLSGTIAGILLFHLMRRYALPAISGTAAYGVYIMLGIDPEEPDEEKKKADADFQLKRFYSEVAGNVLVAGFGSIVEQKTLEVLNQGAYMLSRAVGSDWVLDDQGETMDFAKWKKDKAPFWYYQNYKGGTDLGIFGIGFDQLANAKDALRKATDPELRDTLTTEEQRLLSLAAFSEILYLARLNDADVDRMFSRMAKETLAAAKEREKELARIRNR